MAEQGQNQKPEINIPGNNPKTKFPILPKGVFSTYNIPKVSSKDLGGFTNAKAASMLEGGLILKKSLHSLKKGNSGVIVFNDGPHVEVSVKRGLHKESANNNESDYDYVYTFTDSNGKDFDMPYEENWEFYNHTIPVPFVPMSKVRKQRQRQTRRKGQKGGFYPSVYGGVAGAKMLTPLIARQMMRMYETSNKTRRRKSKKTRRSGKV
jgi:hypothetical protein